MKIVVCIKQVPDTTSGVVKVDELGVLRRDLMPTIINHDDKTAIEAALQLREKLGGTVTQEYAEMKTNITFTDGEMSFISYAEEFQWTIAPGGFERSARAIADGVLEFYSRQEKYLKY